MLGNSERDGNIRAADLPLEKPLCRSESISLEETWKNCFHIGNGVRQGHILSFHLFNFYAEYIVRNAVLDEAQDGIKFARRNKLRYADDTTLMTERKKLKSH